MANGKIDERDRLIYDIIVDRYHEELQLTSDLDSKANNVIGFSGLLATLIAAIAVYLPKGHYPLLFVVPIVILIVSAIEGLRAYWIKTYKAIEPKKFIGEYSNRTGTDTLQEYTATIAGCIEKRHLVNEDKAKGIKYATGLLVLSVSLFFAIAMINWI